MPDGIVDEDGDKLAESSSISVERRRLRGEPQLDVAIAGQGLEIGHSGHGDRGEINGGALDLDPARVRPGEDQEVAYEAR